MKLSEVQTMMERAADALATLPAEQWPGWVIYLLEALDGKIDSNAYRVILETIRSAITTRLNAGRW